MTAATYLDGNFAPVATEVTAADLEVTGAVPPGLAGRYIRTGPNPFAAEADTYHWFAGDGMVHGVDLHGGRPRWYRNRWVRSPEASAHLGGSPVPRADGGWYPGSGNTNVFAHAGRILAVTEGSLPYELTGDLDTVATRNFGGPLPGGINAHPKFDPSTGEMHVMSYGFDSPALRYHVVDPSGELVSTVDIDLPAPVMLHDMGLTASRVVLFDLPVVFDLELALQGVSLPFRWRPDNGARVGILPRAGTASDVVWIDVEPCFVYHPLNAFDAGDQVIIDLVVHDHAFAEDGEPLSDRPRLERWTIDPQARKVLTETIDDRGTEFPRGDERLTGLSHRYGYTIGASSVRDLGALGDDPRTAVRKHDLVGGTTVEMDLGPGRIASEMVFVPADSAAGEDDGWLMGYVYDAARGASDLVIIDAHDFGHPVAAVHLPVRVPQGFHGNWIPDSALA
ncbi:carotenoid oxygenase family protein [Nocardioides sp. S-58]|uniref:Dioxygenase n=1 Tax=Nocardioides renjunii TaxID=3095075 RepID=A0ABU5K671_9ACTN|nr:carotenoid oxygenase family protein [Nocardioides sp. S-58]MDZ5660407.1 carotenoid oxygenase family protein [Nocardioides sp. S-58]